VSTVAIQGNFITYWGIAKDMLFFTIVISPGNTDQVLGGEQFNSHVQLPIKLRSRVCLAI
jgi:hypothetical protein